MVGTGTLPVSQTIFLTEMLVELTQSCDINAVLIYSSADFINDIMAFVSLHAQNTKSLQ